MTALHILPRLAMLLVLLTSGFACGSSTSPTGGSGGIGTGNGQNTTVLAATIDGTAFTTTAAGGSARANVLTISGTSGSGSTVATLAFATTAVVGTSRVAPGSGVKASYQAVSNGVSAGWQAGDDQGSGTVTVTTLTSGRASGTFSFVLAPMSGAAAGPRSILAGTFDVPLT